MKKFAKWLAEFTGVDRDIEREACRQVGNSLLQDSYWFNGGLMYSEPVNDVQNFMILYGEELKEGYIPRISDIRDDVYRARKENLSIQENREVYGYVTKDSSHFIAVDKLHELEDPRSELYGMKKEDLKPKFRIKWKN